MGLLDGLFGGGYEEIPGWYLPQRQLGIAQMMQQSSIQFSSVGNLVPIVRPQWKRGNLFISYNHIPEKKILYENVEFKYEDGQIVFKLENGEIHGCKEYFGFRFVPGNCRMLCARRGSWKGYYRK
jgi:hypothetical protein